MSTPPPSPSSAAVHASVLQCRKLCVLDSVAQTTNWAESVRAARGLDAEFDRGLEWTVSQRDGGRPSDESDSKHDTAARQ